MARKIFSMMIVLTIVAAVGTVPSIAQISSHDNTTVLTVQDNGPVDFVNAQPIDLPQSLRGGDELLALLSRVDLGTPGYLPGGQGDGDISPEFVGAPAKRSALDEVSRQEFGTSGHPFSTARADLLFGGPNLGGPAATNTLSPYRASGKLFFNIGGSTFLCSASLIKPGVVVTAAHCVAAYGQSQFYNSWQFIPGYRNGSAPFGTWTVQTAIILTAYFNGTDNCTVFGVVCPDDVAVLVLSDKNGFYPGLHTGWYGYGWNGFGFSGSLTHVSQIGYPVCLDNGLLMERNDSQGFVDTSLSNNTIIGSLMCGGSSGGPWLVNFGIRPTLTGTTSGADPDPNVVVGVTSWGYTNPAIKEQGASPFTSGNILGLVNVACILVPGACS